MDIKWIVTFGQVITLLTEPVPFDLSKTEPNPKQHQQRRAQN